MVDNELTPWLLEINANPSLKIYNDRELPNGDIEQTLSELDKYVKSILVSDSIAIATSEESPSKLGSMQRILPSDEFDLE